MTLRRPSLRTPLAVVAMLAVTATALPAEATSPSAPAVPRSSGGPIDVTHTTLVGSGTTKYTYFATHAFWSVTAVRPLDGAHAGLLLYGDSGYSDRLTDSRQLGTRVDFVVVDSNRSSVPTSFYPKARSDGDFIIQNDSDNVTVTCTGATVATRTIAAGGIVEAIDLSVPLPGPHFITVTSNKPDTRVFFMTSLPPPPTWYQGRPDGTPFGGDGTAQTLTVAGSPDWHGLVITDRSTTGGSYRITC